MSDPHEIRREPVEAQAAPSANTGSQATQEPALRLLLGHKQVRSAARQAPPFAVGTEVDSRQQPCLLKAADRLRHVYVAGQPGTGKSTLLRNLVLHDLAAGTGACLIDPHGGLIDDILGCARLTSEQRARIIVVDVADREFPVGINLLDARSETEEDLTVQFFLTLFSSMYLLEHQGPVLAQATRNGLLVLMGAKRTLAEYPLLFSDDEFLKAVLESNGIDPFARRYFDRVWRKTVPVHRSEHLAYFTSKFSPFFDDRIMRNILAQRQGLSFDEVMADNKVVLISLARGHIGDMNARLLGQIVLHLVRRSAMRRSLTASSAPFHVYVDEAHELSGGELREMLTALRKFGVGMTLANQGLSEFPHALRHTIMSSVGTFLVLRQGAENAGAFNLFVQPRFDHCDLVRLPDYEAVICLTQRSGYVAPKRVRLSAPPKASAPRQVELCRQASASRYGRPRREVEAELLRTIQPEPAS